MFDETRKVHALLKRKCPRSLLRMTGAKSQYRFSVIAMVPMNSCSYDLADDIADVFGKNAHLYNINVLELPWWRCWFTKHQVREK